MTRLVINADSSWCTACGGHANPRERAHVTLLGDEGLRHGARGCGAVFTEVATEMPVSADTVRRITEMRPDLPFVGSHGIEVHD